MNKPEFSVFGKKSGEMEVGGGEDFFSGVFEEYGEFREQRTGNRKWKSGEW